MLALRGVSKAYDPMGLAVLAVKDVDLHVGAHSFAALMGPSGCGKSSLLTIAGGLQRPDSGDVSVDGVTITDLSDSELCALRRRSIGFVFQDYNLVQMLTVIENVSLPLDLDEAPHATSRGLAREALGELGLSGMEDRFPATLSGGQQQRVALARAFAGGAKLILADEPTGALDSASSTQVIAAMRRLVDHDATVLVGTHDPEVASHADIVYQMLDGQLLSASAAVAV